MKSIFTVIVFFIVSLGYNPLAAQEYLWPTDASHFLTSSFAEYRPGHFHAGIDVKTWGQIGYKVFAIRDGYISRIGVSPFGYGKVIYHTMDTGETVVYAHLSGFNKRLEAFVRGEQKAKKSYRINAYLKSDQFPVKKGEVIGYTGDTGIGYPHLHFEMRDQGGNPINPFLRGYKVEDTIPPAVSAISISPLTFDSRVNGDATAFIEQPTLVSNARYELHSRPVVSGEIGFAVDCFDQANGVDNKFAVHKLDFYIDETLTFSATYNTFSYAHSHFIDFDRDYRLNERGLGLFQKFYKDEFNELPIYLPKGKTSGRLFCDPERTAADPSSKILAAGEHQFRAELFDFFGNVAVVQGKFMVGTRAKLVADLLKESPGRAVISGIRTEDGPPARSLEFFLSSTGGAPWKSISPEIIEQFTTETAPPKYSFVISPVRSGMILKIQATDDLSIPSLPLFYSIGQGDSTQDDVPQFSIVKDFYDDYVRLVVRSGSPLLSMPKLLVQQTGLPATEIPLRQTNASEFAGVYKLIPVKNGSLSFEVGARDAAGNELLNWDQLDIAPVTPALGGAMSSKDAKCAVSFKPGAVYDTLYLRIEPIGAVDNPGYDAVGQAYQIQPSDIPMKGKAKVQLSYPYSDLMPNKLAVYRKGREKWSFVGAALDEVTKSVSCDVSGLGAFTLIRDEAPPVVNISYPAPGQQLTNKRPTFTAVVFDELSGIADERSIIMKIDDEIAIAEFDPETKTLTYQPDEPLAPGSHRLSVRAIDNSKNESTRVCHFVIIE